MNTLIDSAVLRLPVAPSSSDPAVPAWTSAVGPAEHAAALSRASDPLSLYVHIPFCRERCTFCDCTVVVARSAATADRYLTAVMRELDLVVEMIGDGRRLAQIAWGGGTPTFLTEHQLEMLWKAIARRFHVLRDADVSIEIDPRHTTSGQLHKLRGLGFNRLAIGVQDLDERVQEAIGRNQTAEETHRTFEAARAEGFECIGFDLVYGLPQQTLASWRSTLSRIIGMRPDRISLSAFAHNPGLRPRGKRQYPALVSRDAMIALLIEALEALSAAGYREIGTELFALPTDALARAAESGKLTRNFEGFGVHAGQDVIGVGVSAISDVGGQYAQNVRSLVQYEARIADGQLATDRGLAQPQFGLV